MSHLPLHRGIGAAARLALCITLASGCSQSNAAEQGGGERPARDRGDIVIAAAWPWAARPDIRFGEGIDLAVGEINAAGGIGGRPVRILRVDDQETVDQGRVVAQRLAANPEVVAVIGHLQSYVTVPAAAIYDLSGLVLISPASTDPQLTGQGYHRVFRETFTDSAVGRQLAHVAASRGYRRVAILYIRNAYGRGLSNAFEERASGVGITVVARQSYDGSGTVTGRTFEPTLAAWKSLPMDAIILAGEVPSAAVFAVEARREGLTVPIIGGDAMNTPALMAIAGSAAEGMIVASIFHPDEPRPEVQRFTASFRQRYGIPPDAASALGYDAVKLLATAVRRGGSTAPDSLAKVLHALRGWAGVTGTFTFDAAGDPLNKPVGLMLVRNGKFEYLPDAEPAVTLAGSPRRD